MTWPVSPEERKPRRVLSATSILGADERLVSLRMRSFPNGSAESNRFWRFSREKRCALRERISPARSGRGQWGDEHLETLTASEAGANLGETATVCGVVVSAKYATRVHGAPTFLNLDRPYPDHPFTIVIWETDRGVFGEPEVAYADKLVCVTGKIDAYKGKPQIVATDPSQIELQESR